MPRKIFATSEAILETSSELSIEADGGAVRLVSLEEGPGSWYVSLRPIFQFNCELGKALIILLTE